jgi:MHS family citrate/tricarballylate:H+ symporter-like MFS transporter
MAEALLIDTLPPPGAGLASPKQIAGVVAGNALEFYDFLTFSFFAIDIGKAFFPSNDPTTSLLASLATFGAGFLTRPLGAFVLGRMGDRIGRKPAMLICFGLMGLAIAGMALTPSYAQIGAAAPMLIVIFRLLQGFALGGEVGPSTAYLAEVASAGRRGLMISLQYLGQGMATLAAGLVGVTLSAVLSAGDLHAIGWRIALGLGVVIVPFGLMLRRGLTETLHAAEPAASGLERTRPTVRVLILALLLLASGTTITYVLNYLTTYSTATLHMATRLAFTATVIRGLGTIIGSPLGGWLADRFGRRTIMLAPGFLLFLLIIPSFMWLSQSRTGTALFTVTAAMSLLGGISGAAVIVAITEQLPKPSRSTSLALVYALSISIFGGSAQFNVAWLTAQTHSVLAPAWYLLIGAAAGLVAMLWMRESAPARIER